MPVAATIRTAPIGTDPNAAAQPDGAVPVEMFGEIISGLAEGSVEGALIASVPVASEVIATKASPASGEGEVAKTVEQLLALSCSHPAEAAIAEASEDGEEIPTALSVADLGDDAVVAQDVAVASTAIGQLPQYRTITPPTDVETQISSADRPGPKALSVPDLPQNPEIVPVLTKPDVLAGQALGHVPQPAPVGARMDVAARQALGDVPQPASAGARMNVVARQAFGDVPQPASAGARMDVVARQAFAEVPSPVPAEARLNMTVGKAMADAPQPARAEARITAPQAGGDDQTALPPISGQPPAPVEAPQIASPRTEAVVQVAFASLEAAAAKVPAQPWAVPSKATDGRTGDAEPTIALPEPRLGTATTLPSINPVAAPFELLRPAEAAPIGPQPVPLDPGELEIKHQLHMAHEGEWLDQLARDIARSAGGEGRPLRFRLNPENLGNLRVEISQDRSGAAIRLTTETEAARVIIADAQPRLIAEARAHGIRITEAHVDVGGQTASGDPRRQNANFEEAPLRTARSLQEHGEGDGNPTPGQSERYA